MSCFEQRPLFAEPISSAQELTPLASNSPYITEISLNSQAHLAKSILAGMLLELSANADPRWLCWVAERPLKPLLAAAGNGVAPQGILQVVGKLWGETPQNRDRELCDIAVRALESGKSHTVAILVSQQLDVTSRTRLASAAIAGNAECLVIQLQA